MIKDLQKTLLGIGLSEKEANVLSVLLENKSLKAAEIARRSHLNRATTYVIIKSLLQKGLVTSSRKYNVAEFQAIDPALLVSYIDREKQALEEQKRAVRHLLPDLERLRANLDVLPKVAFFEGREGVKQAYEDTLDNNRGKVIYVFSGPDIVFQEMGEDYVAYYVNKRTRLGIRSFQIAPMTPAGEKILAGDKDVLRVTKLIPKAFAFDTEMVMYDNKLGIFSFAKDKLMAVIIEDQLIVNTLLALFRYIDQTLSKK